MMSADPTQARMKAREVLINCGIDRLPLDFRKITAACDMISIVPYSRAMERYGLSKEELFEIYGVDGSCICTAGQGFYVIYYNDLTPSRGRSRFTIAHELGHIFLRHRRMFMRAELLGDAEYRRLEQDAHNFAGFLLAPPPVLNAIGELSARDIAILCRVSDEAAEVAHSRLSEYTRQDEELCGFFAEYIADTKRMMSAGRV
jgi:Zn-dependent peptidase ImmA (M78 family)